MVTIIQQLETLEVDLSRKSPKTVKTYLCISRKFLVESGDFSRAGMLRFINNYGSSDNSIRLAYYALSRLCRALGKTFPLDEDDIPSTPDESQLVIPTMNIKNVEKLILYWREYPDSYPTSLLFLSSIYGLRAIEMTDVDVGRGQIVVIVAKRKKGGRLAGGVTRTHLLPVGMEIYLSGYQHYSERTVNYAFGKICKVVGVKQDGNFHSIRHSLDTELIKLKVDRVLIKAFMRWAKDRRDMSVVYFHMPPAEIDGEIFKVHPFLPFWRS